MIPPNNTEIPDPNESLLREIIPSKEILDLSILPDPINTEAGFRNAIVELCKDERLPAVFPEVADFFKVNDPRPENKWKALSIDEGAKNTHLTLPKVLLRGDTYENSPLLRGPMEEIILAYEGERVRQGFPISVISGTGWSENFLERLGGIQKPIISNLELDMDKDDSKIEPPIKGTKIA